MRLDLRASVLRVPRRPGNPVILLLLLLVISPVVLLLYSSDHPHELSTLTRTSLEFVQPSGASSELELSTADDTRILLVSAFYPLTKSKHTLRQYKKWLSLFLRRITTDVYFFAPPDWEPMIREIRGDLPIVINTTFASPFDIPPLRGRREKYKQMHAQDREAHIHSPELYAVWATKSYFLKEGLCNARTRAQFREQIGNEYKYAFWTDAGAFRHEHLWKEWPDPMRVKEVWAEGVRDSGMKAEDLVFFPIEGLPHRSLKVWREDMGPIDNSISEGSFFGGMPSAIDWWYNLYFSYHNHWLDKGHFVGKDQTVINALFMLYPSCFIGVWLSDTIAPAAVSLLSSPSFSSYDVYHPPPKAQLESPLGQCLEYWYYYVFFLGSEVERANMADQWLTAWRWMWPWKWVAQIGTQKEPCRLTKVLTVESALRRALGGEWDPPVASVTVGKMA